jgi:2-polyprenyl-3-methyl-5-hydroxy-6-metoxy-1,4-benzoquinol methylase
VKLEPPFLADERVPLDLATERASCCVCGAAAASDAAARGYDYEYRTSRRAWVYRRCRECALVYLDPRPAVAELGRIYPPHYYSFIEGSFDEGKRGNALVAYFRRRLEAGKAREFARLAGPGAKRVLDVGCGDGRFLAVLRDHGPRDWVLEGIDIDAAAVARARANGLAVGCSRLEDFAAGSARYDLVVLFQTIEHVSDPRDTCRKIRGLLNPGGLCVIETPDVAGWDERLFRAGLWGGYHIPRHWNLFTPDNLARLLDQQGFDVVARASLISTSFWINSLYNALLVRAAPGWLLRFFHYQNPLLLAFFIALDKLRMACGARTSNQRIVARAR